MSTPGGATVEVVDAGLAEAARPLVEQLVADAAASRLAAQDVFNAVVVTGPLAEGCASQAPYDAMLIEGAIEIMPEALARQLREGGRVVALFREGNLGVVRLGRKIEGHINWRFAFNAAAPWARTRSRSRASAMSSSASKRMVPAKWTSSSCSVAWRGSTDR